MQATITQQQLTIAETRSRIIELLHLDEDHFHYTLYEVGVQYLHEYTKGDKLLVDFTTRRKEFWSWWKTKWFERDRVLLEALNLESVSLNYLHQLYADYHSPQVLAKEIFPPRVVYGIHIHSSKNLLYAS